MTKDCAACKDLTRYAMLEFARTCRGYPDYSLGELQYCPHQIEWLLKHGELLHEGRRPIMESGYTDAPSKGRKSDATRVQDVIMEVERRLEHCGLDGLMAMLYYGDEKDERFLARYYRESEAEIRRRVEATVLHISGRSYNKEFKYNRHRAMRDYFRWQRRG